jgi:hypothetical protein
MAYIGSTPTSQSFTPGTDYFSGDGSTVAFTLTRPAVSINDLIVVIENVVQKPLDAYTVVGTTLTFTSAPPSGTNNIYVRYMSVNTLSVAPNDLSVTTEKIADNVVTVNKLHTAVLQPANISDKANTSTGYLALPKGTTAQRPANPAEGMFRHNLDTDTVEFYDSGVWKSVNVSYAIEYLVIAAGGGGSFGGGGAGGYLTSGATVTSGVSYVATVGAGGAGVANTRDNSASDGAASSLGSIVSTVGGGGGGAYGDGGVAVRNGRAGGSGGGGGGLYTNQTATPGGAGTAGQGNAGGTSGSGVNTIAGGGGGAGGAGIAGDSGGTGGAGLASSITGTSVTRAGGGGGSASVTGTAPDGGSGGGGQGGKYQGRISTAGSENTGSGGGGGSQVGDGYNGNGGSSGGSGIIILRYLGGQRGTGGTVTSSSGYTIHTFTSSGTYTA